jgi:hypothetical protein
LELPFLAGEIRLAELAFLDALFLVVLVPFADAALLETLFLDEAVLFAAFLAAAALFRGVRSGALRPVRDLDEAGFDDLAMATPQLFKRRKGRP